MEEFGDSRWQNLSQRIANSSFLELGALSYQLEGKKGLVARWLQEIPDGQVSVHHPDEQRRIDKILKLTTEYFGKGKRWNIPAEIFEFSFKKSL